MASPAPEKAQRRRRYFATVPPQEILPIVDKNYESKIKGLYVIGDVTGLPLVKIAANHGVDVIDRMERKGVFSSDPSGDDLLDLVIVGGGPAGLSAAIEAWKRQWTCTVLERSFMASTIHGFPPGKKVYAEPRFLKNRSGLPVEGDSDKNEFLAKIDEAVKQHGVTVQEGTEVTAVTRVGDHRFEIRTADGDTYREKDVLVVGGGNSAVEAALLSKGGVLPPEGREPAPCRRGGSRRQAFDSLFVGCEGDPRGGG